MVHKHSTLAQYERIYTVLKEWMYERSEHDITLGYFCERHYLNRRSVQRALQSYGTNWRTMLTEMRIEDAKRKLRTSSLSISDIAFRVGYNNTSLFNRLFKEATGMTPKEYRQEARNGTAIA